MKCLPFLSILFIIFCNITVQLAAQDDITYKQPPKDIADLALAKASPAVSMGKNANWIVLMERSGLTTIEDLAQPELRIAGLRINPANFAPSREPHFTTLQLKDIRSRQIVTIQDLPPNLKAGHIQWNPDETGFTFTNTTANSVDLYRVNIQEKKAYKINEAPLNTLLGSPFVWVNTGTILYKTVPRNIKPVPGRSSAPKGPVVQESKGKAGASRTYQDLIKNPYDEDLFEYYASAQLVKNDLQKESIIGSPAIYTSINSSPDKNYILVQKLNKPFSYLVPYYGFPTKVEVLAMNGELIRTLASNPSSEGAPIGFDDVVPFPRSFGWRNDQPATIFYVQALDKGLGRSKAEYRDAMYTTSPVDKSEPKELFRTRMRYNRVLWGNDQIALVYEDMNAIRKIRINTFNPSTGLLDSMFERSSNDAYSDIGNPVTIKNNYGKDVLYTTNTELLSRIKGNKQQASRNNNIHLLLEGEGASPEGNMPFIQVYDTKQKKGRILWRCQPPYYETVVDVIDAQQLLVLTSRESNTEVPNYFIRDLRKNQAMGTAITDFKNPYPQLEGIHKQKISYKRADSINLTADLYLPKNYNAQKDGPLPVIIWAYPREYKSAADAAQIRGSKYTFTRINYGSPIFWVTQGYAVMDNAEMPIVGDGGKEPNDHFIPQLYLNAHAAIQAVARLGVGDSNRVAVGGHSYGAFMTANLLAHTKLFRAGIARSGAYNRTLTPFGFQAEERTYWEAPDVYFNMSPFSFADRIKTPLLMLHGEADNNSGTFPIQSERLYNAVKGHGGTVRLVILPFESHGYAARENILHMLWEQNNWLEQYVKTPPQNTPSNAREKKAF
ncbi:MAG: prolyl oligopeptidase family serine peptidase [Chitinophagaceae bacterium]